MKQVKIFTRGDGRVAVSFDYDEQIIAGIRAIPGRRWNPEDKKWDFPDCPDARRALERLFTGYALKEYRSDDLDALYKEMKSRQYGRKTIQAYLYYNRDFHLEFCGKPQRSVGEQDLRDYLSFLVKRRKYAAAGVNLALSALKFHYGVMLGKSFVLEKKRPKKDNEFQAIV